MTDRDFEIAGKKFKISKINAFMQFHIVRRIAPLLSELLPALTVIQKSAQAMSSMSESDKLDEFAKIASPILMGLSQLSDENADKVLFGLLSSVEMQQA